MKEEDERRKSALSSHLPTHTHTHTGLISSITAVPAGDILTLFLNNLHSYMQATPKSTAPDT